MSAPPRPLAGRLALVAGASRGVGRGLAIALGEAGASVVVTGRSSRFGARTDARAETVEDTAAAVEAAGGRATPYVLDHADPRALHAFTAYTLRRLGVPDLLAVTLWGGNEGYDGASYPDGSAFGTPFWARGLDGFARGLAGGAMLALATARAFAPSMVRRRSGLICLVGFDGEGAHLGDGPYHLAMAAQRAAATLIAADLAGTGVAAVHLTPGFVRTERVIDAGRAEEAGESPLYAGRALAALAADPSTVSLNGASLFAADLAARYGLTDEDGRAPGRYRLGGDGA